MLRTAEAALEFAFLHDTSLNTRSLTRTTKVLADEKEIKKAYDDWLMAVFLDSVGERSLGACFSL